MGLCKCRTVTALFCFEHRRNVCEKCVVVDHSTCVVKTYLQWLQDSDFDPNCLLCRQPFTVEKESVRLACFDLFHWDCLQKELLKDSDPMSLPALNTLRCPLCRTHVMPVGIESPLIQRLRQLIETSLWKDQLSQPLPATKNKLGNDAQRIEDALNGSQPNGREMITIDVGTRPSLEPYQQNVNKAKRPEESKIHPPPRARHASEPIFSSPTLMPTSFKSFLRILFNCLTLRNVRACSFGVSPRQTILLIFCMLFIFVVSFKLILPTFISPTTL